ncbi:MAG TPA: LacI family DNA-binding transcriptional regulator [Lachnospiraceae bacterium]|nr:LacI family DNA-binding transcriptional regulator [Lachnospiraceae bacterium]
MAKQVTMKDIANALHISTVSVSKALSGKEGVSIEVRERIRITAEEMGYRYNAGVKAIEEDNNYNVGIIIARRFLEDDTAFYSKLHSNIIMKLGNKNSFGIMEVIFKEDEENCTLPAMIANKKVDGIIVLGQLKKAYLHMIMEQYLPITFLDFYDENSSVDSIVSDNVYGSYLLTNYLIKCGHKKIGFIGDIFATSSILDRYLGYYKSLLQNEIPIKEEWLLNDRDENGILRAITFPKKMPTAFVCNCDEVAYRVVEQLKAEGYRIPEDVSIVGFDDYIYATLSNPALTTYAIDLQLMTEMAVESILKGISGENLSPGRKVISGKLIVRNSVAKL